MTNSRWSITGVQSPLLLSVCYRPAGWSMGCRPSFPLQVGERWSYLSGVLECFNRRIDKRQQSIQEMKLCLHRTHWNTHLLSPHLWSAWTSVTSLLSDLTSHDDNVTNVFMCPDPEQWSGPEFLCLCCQTSWIQRTNFVNEKTHLWPGN